MRSILDELQKELSDLKALVESIGPVNIALSRHQDTLVQQYVSVRRRFDYAAFVVALYASFEKYIEDLIAAFITLESRRVQYSALPQSLLQKHLQKSADMLLRGRLGEGRYAGLTTIGVVKNLFECLSGSAPYALNEAAVLAHDSNLRAPQIEELFALVGVQHICDLAGQADAMVEWYESIDRSSSPQLNGVRRQVIEERLKNIVDRRNQVAHRGDALDLLGVEDMKEAIDFIGSFASSIFALVVNRYFESRYLQSTSCSRLEQLPKSWRRKGILIVVDKPKHPLFCRTAGVRP
ncbi:MAG: MAE_28990/MAE_18760 family HEPN-like nuclease [Cellvibrionaceae bacterium]|nr:MAE_28990/MAE_18760 family HEPN-like nuclease [Cellvibrionaceae bacterium]